MTSLAFIASSLRVSDENLLFEADMSGLLSLSVFAALKRTIF